MRRALGELLSFKLGESRNDSGHSLGDRSPDLTVRVSGDSVPQGAEPDAAGLEVIQQLQQVASVAPEPVQLPHHHLITATETVQQPVQLWTFYPGPADPVVCVDAIAPGRVELAKLQIGVLIRQADSCVPRRAIVLPRLWIAAISGGVFAALNVTPGA